MSISRHRALIALGANLPSATGGPRATLEQALRLISDSGIAVTNVARWRRSEAWPKGSGPDFVNGAAVLETDFSAEALLVRLHEVEAELGRARDIRWNPRVCDLDLIAYEDAVLPDRESVAAMIARVEAGDRTAPDRLILPHPAMHGRAFVLAPLSDIAPDWRHPMTGRTVLEMLADLPKAARDEVELLDD